MFWFWFILFTVIIWFMKDQKKKPDDGPPEQSKADTPVWANVIALILISPITALLALFATSCTSGSGNSSSKSSGEISHSEALTICQYAIKGSMIDSKNTDIPYVESNGGGSEYCFSWGAGTKSIRTRNGLGLEIPASASCIVDKRSRNISQLTINGKSVR